MENERLDQRVLDHEAAVGATSSTLPDLPIVGDVRGNVRGDVVQFAPPLTRGQAGFDEMGQVLRHTPTEARGMA